MIFIYQTKENSFDVYDLDTRLPFPCSFEVYKTKALGIDHNLQTQFQRLDFSDCHDFSTLSNIVLIQIF